MVDAFKLSTDAWQPGGSPAGNCDPAYLDFWIPPPPDRDRSDVHDFTALPPDPHHFDAGHDRIGCDRKRWPGGSLVRRGDPCEGRISAS